VRGFGAIGAWQFAVIAAGDGEYLVATIAFLMCGALAGFLPWNFPNARAFLGDAGSHLVGYLLAVMAILPPLLLEKESHPFAVLSPLFFHILQLGQHEIHIRVPGFTDFFSEEKFRRIKRLFSAITCSDV